jgi:hypothetical protein
MKPLKPCQEEALLDGVDVLIAATFLLSNGVTLVPRGNVFIEIG